MLVENVVPSVVDRDVSKGTGRIKRVRALFMEAAHVLRLEAEKDAEGVEKCLLGRIIRLSRSVSSFIGQGLFEIRAE